MSSGAVTVALDGRPTRVGLVRLWDVDGEAFRERVAQAFASVWPDRCGGMRRHPTRSTLEQSKANTACADASRWP